MSQEGCISEKVIKFSELDKFILKAILKERVITTGFILNELEREANKYYGITFSKQIRNRLRARIWKSFSKLLRLGILKVQHYYNTCFILNEGWLRARHMIDLKRIIAQLNPSIGEIIKHYYNVDEIIIERKAEIGEYLDYKEEIRRILYSESELDDEVKEQIIRIFRKYLMDVQLKKIILYDVIEDEYIVLGYENRFTSKRRSPSKKIKEIFRITSKLYKHALMLTLTIDDEKLKELEGLSEINFVERCKLFEKHFNRFLVDLKRYIKRRILRYPPQQRKYFNKVYLKIKEFGGEKGRIHLHVIIFGARFLKKDVIEKYWKVGFVFVSRLIVKKGRWVFVKKPPDYDYKAQKWQYYKKGTLNDGGFYQNDALAYFYFSYPVVTVYDEGGDSGSSGGGSGAVSFDKLDDYDKLNFALHYALNTRCYSCSQKLNELIRLFPQQKKLYEFERRNLIFIACAYEFELEGLLEYLELHAPPELPEGGGVGYG